MQRHSLRLLYVEVDELDAQPESFWRGVIGAAGTGDLRRCVPAAIPVASIPASPLGDAPALCELWRASGSEVRVPEGDAIERAGGRIQFRHCHDFLFGAITVEEAWYGGTAAEALRQATLEAYGLMFHALESTQHRCLVRIWNYLPHINREVGGDERYRHFNAARQAAFKNSRRTAPENAPAASALGLVSGTALNIHFLASRRDAAMIENPRQTSAYHYPPKFGVHRPLFARASLSAGLAGTNLFVSGTASIVGHESRHPNDAGAQTRETLANISALLAEANRASGGDHYSLDRLKLKVYLRRPSDLAAVDGALKEARVAPASVLYLHADVCRRDLLVEIEAAGDSRPS